MEFPDIGNVCVICNRNDYLPFKCSHCDKIVCIDHKNNHGQECQLHQTNFAIDLSIPSESIKAKCDHCKKITLLLELVQCHQCHGSHCLYHRHQVQHNCPKYQEDLTKIRNESEEKIEKQREAVAKVKEIFKTNQNASATSVTCKSTQISDPKKRELAKKIRIMRLKQSATGPQNILFDDRIYFEVRFSHEPKSRSSSENKNGKIVKIFTRKDYTIGRMVDWCATELDIVNRNNIEGADQLVFKRHDPDTGDLIILDNQSRFSENIDACRLDNGDEIIITYWLQNN